MPELHIARLLDADTPRVAEATRGAWYPDLPPALDDEDANSYTDRLTGADRTGRSPYNHRRNRQCSIGYHDECSDSLGLQCECPCHLNVDTISRLDNDAMLVNEILTTVDSYGSPRLLEIALRIEDPVPARARVIRAIAAELTAQQDPR